MNVTQKQFWGREKWGNAAFRRLFNVCEVLWRWTPFIYIMAMDHHWSHVALLWNWESEEFETTSNSKSEERLRHKKYEETYMIKNWYKPYTTINFLHFCYDSLKLHLSIVVSGGNICKKYQSVYILDFLLKWWRGKKSDAIIRNWWHL